MPPRFRWLMIATVASLLWTAREAWVLAGISEPLQTTKAPRRMISLQLAPTAAAANEILAEWNCPERGSSLCAAARSALTQDTWLIGAYVSFGVLLAWLATVAARVPWWTGVVLGGLIILGGACDLAENRLLGLSMDASIRDTPALARAFAFVRLAAMSKFTLLLLGFAGLLVLIGGAARVAIIRKRTPQPEHHGTIEFKELVQRETGGIFKHCPKRIPDKPECETHEAADEQYVSFREADIVGLALSGGGIRSATFNLGLLQGLHGKKLLPLVDYLSTVSGGGYVGAFWSAWLKQLKSKANPESDEWKEKLFPTAHPAGPRSRNTVDTDQERHLREFSGFLAPRWGFFEVESWTAAVAVLVGLIPALLIGLAVIAAAWMAWLALTFPVASGSRWAMASAVVLVTALTLGAYERVWQKFRRESAGNRDEGKSGNAPRWPFWLFALLAVVLAGGAQFFLPSLYTSNGWEWPVYVNSGKGDWAAAADGSGLVRWFAVTGIADAKSAWRFSPRLFDYGVSWLFASLLLVMLRFSHAIAPSWWPRSRLAAFDRVLMRTLGLGVIWCCLAGFWHVAFNLHGVAGLVTAASVSAGVFAASRNWIGIVLQRPRETSYWERMKPHLPQALAYLTLILVAVVVGRGLIELAGEDWYRWWTAASAAVLALMVTLFIEPDSFGLHQFYRDRICRAYTGACTVPDGEESAAANRSTEPRDGDDIRLQGLVKRPLHLVCCAANDLSGDQVETLDRGARSAVLSRYGISLGSRARQLTDGDWLGSAVTASAAAFNSNMGQVSARVGPAVSFLMTALNLRLGLWVRHPAASGAGPRRWPGLLFYREMFGLTSSSGRIGKDVEPGLLLRDIHLSDGGHFENLGLYELIRRHCRYVIVSDCGADPAVAFHDLGNAIRRVREDFGVDIELDIAPLRPGANALSRQHVATGTIHYSPADRGILLYIKPSITGDEPADVLQYRNRNAAFPHESTADQFYDEAQWESYRRLGFHAAEQVFEFVERSDVHNADWVFSRASRQWGPTPEGLESRVLKMTERFGALEFELWQLQSRGVLTDVFPEMGYVPEAAKEPAPNPSADTDAEMASELTFLLRVTQLMDDVWLSCSLDKWWDHPLNMGWINLFARWATCPSFRFWWPLMAPMFSEGFRQFVTHRFPAREGHPDATSVVEPQKGRVQVIDDIRTSNGLAALWWRERSAQPTRWKVTPSGRLHSQFFENVLELRRGTGKVPMQTGLASVIWSGKNVGWTSHDFFVPPSLWGAGIGTHFLKGMLRKLHDAEATDCYVVVKAPPRGAKHQVALDDHRSFADQYRRIGFRTVKEFGDHADLREALEYKKNEDTLLALNLKEWIGLQEPSGRSEGATAGG